MVDSPVRMMLRKHGPRLVQWTNDGALALDANDAAFADALEGTPARQAPLRGLGDAFASVARSLDGRLQTLGLDGIREHDAYKTLLGALTDAAGCEFGAPELSDFLFRWVEKRSAALTSGGLPPVALRRLKGAFSAGDTRSALLELAPLVTGLDAGDLLARCGLELPNRPPRIDATWSTRFQETNRPLQFWFDNIPGGAQLFVIYFTRACRYEQCSGCALPSISARKRIAPSAILEQTDFVFSVATTTAERESVKTLILSNNGSMLDAETTPVAALLHAIVRSVEALPKLDTLVLESRAEFVDEHTLSLIRATLDACRPEIKFEIAIGVEIADEKRRNREARKGLSNNALRRAAENIAGAGAGLRAYFMLKPLPGMSDQDAIDDLALGIDFFGSLSDTFSMPIVIHLNPTYAAAGTNLEEAFLAGAYTPPNLEHLAAFLHRRALTNRVRIHIGLNDEGLATPGGSFHQFTDPAIEAQLRRFNVEQDASVFAGGR
ncbi:MAG: hypothetical protein J0L81_16215 [Caulobacterales bacterium]|nr:hypothetical protein [Caulobacterales bacterium]